MGACMDKPLPEDDEIAAVHPLKQLNKQEAGARWDEAMRLVSAKHSKGALVELVNWLLLRIDMAPSLLQKDYDHAALQIQIRQLITELRDMGFGERVTPDWVADRLEGVLEGEK